MDEGQPRILACSAAFATSDIFTSAQLAGSGGLSSIRPDWNTTRAGTPSARSARCSPATSRSWRIVTFTAPPLPFDTVQATNLMPPGPVTTGAPVAPKLADAAGGAARPGPVTATAVTPAIAATPATPA